MTTHINFDALAGKAFEPTATSDDYETLFAAVFSLPDWYFIADAEFQYKMPYCAPFKIFDDATTLTVFTDGERARKFIAEGGLKGGAAVENAAPEDLILRISTDGILDFFDRLAPFNIVKIFFNPNVDSHGFHHDLKMMRPIYEHLESKGLLGKNEPKTTAENPEYNFAKLVEENADVIADFERENKDFSYLIGASAAAMTMCDDAGKEQITAKMVEMFENRRIEFRMPPKVFRVFIEKCLSEREFLMPMLAFASLQQDKTKWQKLEQDKEFIDEYARWTIQKLVPGSEVLMDEPETKTVETDFQTTAKNKKSFAKNDFDFDELSRKINAPNPPMEAMNDLFGSVFSLEKWEFIARGELPNVYPYVASNPNVAGNQPMIRAFTDSVRLQRFAKENNLTRADGSVDMLTIPTKEIVPYLEGFIEQGAYGIWFNSDSASDGFFIPIKQLQPIKDHLAEINWRKKGAPPQESETADNQNQSSSKTETLIVKVKDGLMLPSGFVSQATYACNFYIRVSSDWLDGEKLKEEKLEKIYRKVYGETWRQGNSDGSRYVVLESSTKILAPDELKLTKFDELKTTDENQFWFYKANANGEFDKLEADEFQKEIDAELQTINNKSARARQDNLANWGMSETPGGDFDLNLTVNKIGAVNFGTAIAPFYEAIAPLLKDFQGTGDYATLLKFEPDGKSQEVENIAENSHGAYLQIRRFLYLNPKNGTRIGVNSIHSNSLRHVESNAELLVSFELCKNLDNQTAAFYHAFQGPKSDVLNLVAAIQPILESVGYQSVQ